MGCLFAFLAGERGLEEEGIGAIMVSSGPTVDAKPKPVKGQRPSLAANSALPTLNSPFRTHKRSIPHANNPHPTPETPSGADARHL